VRRSAFIAALSCVLAGSVAGPVVATASAPAPTSAVAYQEDAAHDGHSDDASFVGPLSKLWTANLGGEVFYPLIVGDRVFIDSVNASGSGTSVEARSLNSGDLLWGPIDIGGLYKFGGISYDDGRVFALNHGGTLWAFDAASGAQDWSVQLPGQYSFTSSPTAHDGAVYVSGAGSGGTVYAVDEANGHVTWSQAVENGDSSAPAVDSSGVYVSYACEQAYSFTAQGALRWHHSTGCEGGGGRTDVLHAGVDYIRDDAGMTPAELSESDGTQDGSFTTNHAPAFEGSTMVTLGGGGVLTATDLDSGTTIWRNQAKSWWTAPLIVNGYVVAGARDGTVELLDERTGTREWSGSAGSTIRAPNEHNAVGVVGLAEANGALAVPADDKLTLFSGATTPHARITRGPGARSYVRSRATFRFDSNQSGASYKCTLDHNTVGCTSPYTITDLSNGPHRFSVAVTGYPASAAARQFVADRRAPKSTMAQPRPRFPSSRRVRASWRATDKGSGVRWYDVRLRRTANDGSAGHWQRISRLTDVRVTQARIAVRQHATECLSVRARDRVGNVSGWSAPRCVTGLTDDRQLRASRAWFRGSSTSDFDETFTGTSKRGATLRLRHVDPGRVAVSAIVCGSCGSIRVGFGKVSKTFSLRSSLTGTKLFKLAMRHHPTNGRLVIRVVSHGKQVEIDGVGIDSV
jgi:outer membrane protein assembly factor BamB